MKRSGASVKHLRLVYLSMIRSALEYAVAVWHPGLTEELSSSLESIQKRAIKVMLPHMSYDNWLSELKLTQL